MGERMDKVESGVSNFRSYQLTAMQEFADAKAYRQVREVADKKRDRSLKLWLAFGMLALGIVDHFPTACSVARSVSDMQVQSSRINAEIPTRP